MNALQNASPGWYNALMREDTLQDFKERLRSRGINPSYHRIKILEYLWNNRIHPTPETIFQALKTSLPTLSRTTVYNTLKLFVEYGMLVEITTEDREGRYDVDTRPHAHFRCISCGKFFDLGLDISLDFPREIEGNLIKEGFVYLRGVCIDCRKSDSARR